MGFLFRHNDARVENESVGVRVSEISHDALVTNMYLGCCIIHGRCYVPTVYAAMHVRIVRVCVYARNAISKLY